ncbi:MAG: hypothetical protein ACRCX2_27225 [Paraclostridium sp.]
MRFESKKIENYIRVFPEKLPYSFQIDKFNFEIFVNTYSNDLYINGYDENGEILGKGSEKMILDFPLWWCYHEDDKGNFDSRYPAFRLVPRSPDGKEVEITRENYGAWLLAYEVI